MVHIKIIFWLILICLGVYIVIKIFTSIFQRFTQVPQDTMYTLGASLSFSGKITIDNQFPNYTHSLMTNEWTKIWLKSSTINLNTYVHTPIELVGRLKKYFKVTPVIEVDMLKIPDQWLVITANKYFFAKDFVYFDFSTQPQLSAIKSWSDIQLWFDDRVLGGVERFVCSKILKTRDCTYLINNYIQTNKDNFESYRSYVFYKHGTGFWTTFDGNQFGYLFKDISDDMILDLSNMFKIVNKDFIITNKLNLITSNCQNDFSQFSTVNSEWILTYHDPYMISLDLKWFDKKNVPVVCKITFDVRNNRNVTDVQYNN